MKKRLFIGIFLAIVVVGTVLALTVFKGGENSEITYKMEKLEKGNIQALVVTTGSLNPVNTVDVGSQVSGKIEAINVDFNSEVKAGQIIAQIEQSLFITKVKQNEANLESSKAAVEKASVALDNTKKKFDRAISLFDKELISFEEKETAELQYFNAKAELQSQEARLQQAESQLDATNVDLQHTIIKSPIDGVVINRSINVGQTVAASFNAPLLFQIANDLAKMQVECSVDEADIGSIKEGQNVQFNVDAFPNDRFRGVVRQVRYSPVISQNVVTYTTIVEVDNPELKLRPGMTATVSIIVGEARGTLRVPNSALRFTPELSQEEMREMFQGMMGGNRSESGGQNKPSAERSSQGRQSGGQMGGMGMMGSQGGSGQRGGMRDMGRVWLLDENGELKMVFIRTGVTDNTFTQIVSGDLEEGMEIITGQEGGSDSRSRNDMGRSMMRFMR
ncbi:efflux RND transporter periplasmic adaptor subunit [Acidobacteriota bacterium]